MEHQPSTNNLFGFQKKVTSTPTFVKKFYFLDYFFILLKSVKFHSTQKEIFQEFILLKNKSFLGESKYRKLTVEDSILTKNQIVKYAYTFNQVLGESIDYELVKKKSYNSISGDQNDSSNIYLTPIGEKALKIYEECGKLEFNNYIFNKMEEKHFAFYQLLKLCFQDNTLKNGLLVFPIYSGLKLGFDKSTFTTNQHVIDYSNSLTQKLENDIETFTKKRKVSLKEEEKILLNKLRSDGAIGNISTEKFDTNKYNAVLSRFRKYWLNYFLKNIYKYDHSFDTFNIWVERAKQVGILHTTEFFPNFSGRLIYPTAIITNNTSNTDFVKIFEYETGEKLFIHDPNWNAEYQNQFVKILLEEYYFLQKDKNTHFINLLDLKERVCFKLRISGVIFDKFLEFSYLLNLQGKLNKIQISLEADRLPNETSAMYLKREPVLINGKLKNIIAINYK